MLNKLGFFITKLRWWVIAAWVVAAICITAFSPKLSSVTSSDQTSFLPSKYESVQAQKIADKSFPQTNDDNEILVVQRQDEGKLTYGDINTIDQLGASLQAAHLHRVVSVHTSPRTTNALPAGALNKETAATADMVQILVSGQSTGDSKDVDFTNALRAKIKTLVTGSDLKTGLTGQIAESADSSASFGTATKIVTFATFLLVIILPGIIFRSPVAAFAPVLAVSMVYLLAQSLIALAAKTFGFKISNQLSILYTIVLFGIGTDYILFLLFRYREKLRTGDRGRDVVAFALSRAGEAILSAALVVAAAFAALGFSDFGLFKNLAPGLVICVLTMLLAVLTLIPAVISIIGPKIFWPSKAWQVQPESKRFKRIGHFVARRPGTVAMGTLVLLLALASGYPQLHTSFDFDSSQPQDTESAQALKVVSSQFSAGAISPTIIFVNASQPLTNSEVRAFTKKVQAIPGISPSGDAELSKDKKTAELTVLIDGSATTTATLDKVEKTIRPAIHAAAPAGTHVYVNGESAAFVDVRAAVSRDLSVILPAAAVIIFVILAFLLRSLVAPLYLLIAIALGYTATLGGTVYLFQKIQGNGGLIFFIPVMVYIFVVAIGTDYNILTMVRLREEVRKGLKPRAAADMTIEHSSSTVASAGIILAGTFGSLALAGISLLAELGFAVAFGILLSAFCIATLQVPAVSALLGYKIWWPGHKPAQDKNRP